VRETGAEPALAFNVGSLVTRPDAYRHAIEVAAGVLATVPFKVRLVDIGGGFPRAYPGFPVPPIGEYFAAVAATARGLPMAEDGVLLAEPGRALAAPGLSAVVEVLLRKDRRLYVNDGMYGIFWELRFKAHKRFPVRARRDARPLEGPTAMFSLYGPTCDASDVLPGEVELPAGVRAGDHLEFGQIGAYSLSGRTRFNGHYSDRIVRITAGDARPPA
jgi:ornithine decarboxylase